MKVFLRHAIMSLFCLALLIYMGFLLNDLYRSRSELQQTARAKLLDDTGKKALGLGYYFSERVNDLQNISESRELSAYFENVALGMSMEYGLAASLQEANAAFVKFQSNKHLGTLLIYKRLVFVDARGHKLADSLSDSAEPVHNEEQGWKGFLTRNGAEVRFYATGQGEATSIVLAKPYIINGKHHGFILAWLSPTEIVHHFLGSVRSHNNTIFLMFGNRQLHSPLTDSDQAIGQELLEKASSIENGVIVTLPFPSPGNREQELAAFRTPIEATPFSLLTFIPAANVEASSLRMLVAVSAFIGILILAGSFVIIRSNMRNSVLNVRLEEIHIREKATEQQNILLQEANRIAEAAREVAEVSEKGRAVSEERLSLVLDGSNDGIWDWDIPSGRIFINRRWAEILSYTLEELPEPTVKIWEEHLHPQDLSWVYNAIKQHLDGVTPPFELEYRMKTKSGDFVWILDRGKVVERDGEGNPLRVAGAHTDITRRKMTEEKLHENAIMLEQEIAERQQAQEQLAVKQLQLESLNSSLRQKVDETVTRLRQTDQMLISQGRQASMGEMIGNIAHQWRQPLNALSMLIANLQFAQMDNELSTEFMEKSALTANRLIQKMSSTINDFRNFFSPDKEKIPFSALQQIRHAVGLVDAAFKNSSISIVINVEQEFTLNGFPNEYSQVLLNLLSNAKEAIQATGTLPGLITINLTQQGNMGTVKIRDTGGGIPDAVLDKIFEPYFSTKNMGTGIGLYMSKMIIERNMNGLISAHNVDSGAEFVVRLPLAEETS